MTDDFMVDLTQKAAIHPKLCKFMTDAYLTYFRKRRGKTSQNEFGEWLGVSSANISRYIAGAVMPSPPSQDKIALRLGVGIYDACGVARRVPPGDEVLGEFVEAWPELNSDERNLLRQKQKEIIAARHAAQKLTDPEINEV